VGLMLPWYLGVVRFGNAEAKAKVAGGLLVDFLGLWFHDAAEMGDGGGFGCMARVVVVDEEFGYMEAVVEVD
jgi:hypothetical protein